jgi:hypothetical protein
MVVPTVAVDCVMVTDDSPMSVGTAAFTPPAEAKKTSASAARLGTGRRGADNQDTKR